MSAPKKRASKKMAAKKRPGRRSQARSGGPSRKSRKPQSSSPVLVTLLIVSLLCLGLSVYLLVEEKSKSPSTTDLDRKVQELARSHPDAEVFNLEETEKKKP